MAEPFQLQTESLLAIKKWGAISPGLQAGFTTRKGGYSAPPFHSWNLGLHVPDVKKNVDANRQKLSGAIRFPLQSWVSGEQSHKTNIHIVTAADKGKGAETYKTSLTDTDGLITKESGILCTAFLQTVYLSIFLILFRDISGLRMQAGKERSMVSPEKWLKRSRSWERSQLIC